MFRSQVALGLQDHLPAGVSFYQRDLRHPQHDQAGAVF